MMTNKKSTTLVTLYLENITKEELLSACLYSIAVQSRPVDMVIFTYNLSDENSILLNSLTIKPYFPLIKKDENGNILVEKTYTDKNLNVTVVPIDHALNFASFFNESLTVASQNGYETFSICEQEDNFSEKWFEVSEIYKNEKPSAGIFIPLIRNTSNGIFNRLSNEISFVENMVEEVGSVDIAVLMRFNCVNPLGALYVTDKIKQWALKPRPKSIEIPDENIRAMKESIKLSHYYEFFLRLVYNDLKLITVPRVGYECNQVSKNIFNDSSIKIPENISNMSPEIGGITQQEGSFWMELAKKEYFFGYDRNTQYKTPSTVKAQEAAAL